MIKSLPLVIFSHQNQLFALEAGFVTGQGKTAFSATSGLLLSFSQLLIPETGSRLTPPAHWLSLAADSSCFKPWLLGIEKEAELIELPAEDIHPLPPLLFARRTFPALQAVAWYQQRLVSLIDVRVLQDLARPLLSPPVPGINQVG